MIKNTVIEYYKYSPNTGLYFIYEKLKNIIIYISNTFKRVILEYTSIIGYWIMKLGNSSNNFHANVVCRGLAKNGHSSIIRILCINIYTITYVYAYYV